MKISDGKKQKVVLRILKRIVSLHVVLWELHAFHCCLSQSSYTVM